MRPFAKILLTAVATDILTSIGFTFLQLQMESVHGVVFARGGRFWFGSNMNLKCSGVAFAGVIANLFYWSAPLQSLYRYFVVCRKKVISVYATIAIQCIVVLISGTVGIFYYREYRPLSESPEKLQMLMNLTVWSDEPDVKENFCYLNINSFVVGLYCFVIVFQVNFAFVVLTWTSLKVYRFLEASKGIMSQKTRIIHAEFSKKIFYQTILPSVVGILIFIIVGCAYFMEHYPGGLYMFLFFPFPLNSIINPLITIGCVHRYRQITKALVLRSRPAISSDGKSTVNAVPANSSRQRSSSIYQVNTTELTTPVERYQLQIAAGNPSICPPKLQPVQTSPDIYNICGKDGRVGISSYTSDKKYVTFDGYEGNVISCTKTLRIAQFAIEHFTSSTFDYFTTQPKTVKLLWRCDDSELFYEKLSKLVGGNVESFIYENENSIWNFKAMITAFPRLKRIKVTCSKVRGSWMDDILSLNDCQLTTLVFFTDDLLFNNIQSCDLITFLKAQKRGFKLHFRITEDCILDVVFLRLKKDLCEQLLHMNSKEFDGKVAELGEPTRLKINDVTWYLP
uniref:G_PROTEIN_RECEP_F1_2 domain-containing protein n=1 Tax=Panagrellus redivivus TaxID=6233 RepID=A0A7E4VVA5_PANRE